MSKRLKWPQKTRLIHTCAFSSNVSNKPFLLAYGGRNKEFESFTLEGCKTAVPTFISKSWDKLDRPHSNHHWVSSEGSAAPRNALTSASEWTLGEHKDSLNRLKVLVSVCPQWADVSGQFSPVGPDGSCSPPAIEPKPIEINVVIPR